MNDYYFEGDPAVDSTRRQLERIMQGRPPRRRWPWFVAAFAGGAALTIWRMRSHRPKPQEDAGGETQAAAPDRRQG